MDIPVVNIIVAKYFIPLININLYKLVKSKAIHTLEINSGEDSKRIDNVFKLLKETSFPKSKYNEILCQLLIS